MRVWATGSPRPSPPQAPTIRVSSRRALSETGLDTSVNAIRAGFLDFFERNDHRILPSSALVPRHDPTLMFTNAGMVQFKSVLTGAEKPDYPRVATAQKCVRAGGKHNDLDNVGYTARHHTFFEMLGNFSFGDYFKERAIELAWQLLTKDFALDKKRLLITVFADDDEAAVLWKKIAGLSDDKIIRIAGSDNFWSMGDLGPCGPCSEIFYDHGAKLRGGPPGSADADGDRFVEIWNLVFMQSEQLAGGKRVSLPHPSIDTGMGLERIAAVLQGTHDNYEIDLFKALIAASVSLTGVPAKGEAKPSHRVIADHLRASAFLVADGVLPSNEGRGYVLRRIMRRAMRHAAASWAPRSRCSIGWCRRFSPRWATLIPSFERGSSLIVETLKLEETRFRDTLERGLRLLEEATEGLKRGDMLSGRGRLQALRHLWLPLRPHRGRAEGPRRRRRHQGFRRRHGAATHRGAEVLGGLRRGRDRDRVVRAERGGRGHRVPRLRCRDLLGRDRRARQGRQARRRAEGRATAARSSSIRRRSTANRAGRSATAD